MVIPQGIYRLRKRLLGILAEADTGLSSTLRELLQSLAHARSALDTSVAEVTPRLTRISRDLDACQRLQEMDGIGPLNATALVAALGHGHDVRHGRQVAAWLGLVPRQYSRGGKTRFAGLSTRGHSDLRCLLMHGARSVVSRARMNTDATRRWMRQLVVRAGVHKACVAVANTMARVAWALLRTGAHDRQPAKRQGQVASSRCNTGVGSSGGDAPGQRQTGRCCDTRPEFKRHEHRTRVRTGKFSRASSKRG